MYLQHKQYTRLPRWRYGLLSLLLLVCFYQPAHAQSCSTITNLSVVGVNATTIKVSFKGFAGATTHYIYFSQTANWVNYVSVNEPNTFDHQVTREIIVGSEGSWNVMVVSNCLQGVSKQSTTVSGTTGAPGGSGGGDFELGIGSLQDPKIISVVPGYKDALVNFSYIHLGTSYRSVVPHLIYAPAGTPGAPTISLVGNNQQLNVPSGWKDYPVGVGGGTTGGSFGAGPVVTGGSSGTGGSTGGVVNISTEIPSVKGGGNDLKPGTLYTIYLALTATLYNATNTAYSYAAILTSATNFTTKGCIPPFALSQLVTAVDVNGYIARFSFSNPGGTAIVLQYKRKTAQNWKNVRNYVSGTDVFRLNAGRKYLWRIKYTCNDGSGKKFTGYVKGKPFTTTLAAASLPSSSDAVPEATDDTEWKSIDNEVVVPPATPEYDYYYNEPFVPQLTLAKRIHFTPQMTITECFPYSASEIYACNTVIQNGNCTPYPLGGSPPLRFYGTVVELNSGYDPLTGELFIFNTVVSGNGCFIVEATATPPVLRNANGGGTVEEETETAEEPVIPIEIAPNPVSHTLLLRGGSHDEILRDIIIIDMAGRRTNAKASLTMRAVDVSTLHPGMYTCIIETNKGRYNKKFIKQ